MRCGKDGICFLREASNNPSACSLAFNCSNANCKAPAPLGSMNSAEICNSPRSSYTVMRPRTVTCNPFSGRKRRSLAEERNITTRICADSSLRVKYKCPESGTRRLEISPSTQQSEYSRSISERTADTSAPTVQTRRSGGRNWNPSWSAMPMSFDQWFDCEAVVYSVHPIPNCHPESCNSLPSVVILSAAGSSRSEVPAESKDPYSTQNVALE